MKRLVWAVVLLWVMVGLPCLAGRPALAAPATAPDPAATAQPTLQRPHSLPVANVMTIDAGSGRVIQLGGSAASVFAADPKVAEARPASATSLFIFGVAPGRTTVAALDGAGAPIAQYDIIVRPSAYGAGEADAAIARSVPGAAVRVETMQNGLTVTGQVKTPTDADRVMQIVRGYLPPGQTADNRLTVTSSIQVNLSVRIAEMSRNLVRQLGVNWQALGNIGKIGVFPALALNANANLITSLFNPSSAVGTPLNLGGNFNALIDALAQDELVHILAEPNLTTISGEAASFLVGGEFPVPVSQQNNQVTIEFKQFGVSLAFVPTVASDGQITLKVRPEVSEISNQNAVQLAAGSSTIVVPSLIVRRAETTVQLGSGQTFAIAGLLQDSTSVAGSGVPILGDLPILGALFRSDNFKRNETELVIVVTPYLVRPVADPATLRLPTDGWQAPNDLERILLLRQRALAPNDTGAANLPAARIPGQAGFVVQ
jgi:pilus assembly protein CpaC